MSVPILSVQHIKAKLQKYQVIAMICAVITVVAFVLATISSSLLADRIKKQSVATAQLQSSQNKLEKQINSLKDRHQQFENMNSELNDTQTRLSESQNTIKMLKSKVEALEKKLSEASANPVLPAD